MNIDLPPQEQSKPVLPRPRPIRIGWLSLLVMFLVPALACNLPERQRYTLTFPTADALPAFTNTPGTGSEATLFPVTPDIPPTALATPLPGSSPFPFWGLSTATPGQPVAGTWSTPDPNELLPPFTYWSQPGDTLSSVAARFGVSSDQVSPAQPSSGLLLPGQQLGIPNLLGHPPHTSAAMPDSAVVYSPQAAGFSIHDYVAQAGGFLSTYQEEVDKQNDEWLSGSEIVELVALNTSVNPKILLSFLEYRSGWVRGQPANPERVDYPIGFYVPEYDGLFPELSLAAKELNIGYYGWRQGSLTELVFPGGTRMRLNPGLNAGSVAVHTLTSKFHRQQQDWLDALYGPRGFLAVYTEMFGDPWQSAASVEPLYTHDLLQPNLELPFVPGERWALTAGPHISWNTGTPRGALDFSPITGEKPCAPSSAWVTASAPGLVVRTEDGVVALDLDGDGFEQTGWVLIYMHIAERDRVPLGTWVEVDTLLGHPSCEGGRATGTNVHFTRKYNGEWLSAEGPVPLVLSGWAAHEGRLSYEGTLEKDGHTVSARSDGSSGSTIVR